MKNIQALISSLLISGWLGIGRLMAQGSAESVEMADAMRANGKIYVVVAVIVIIFAGVIFYLFRLDSKISKVEKELKSPED